MASKIFSVADLTVQNIAQIFDHASALKKAPARFRRALESRQIGVLDATAGFRWRAPFVASLQRLGGQTVMMELNGDATNPAVVRDALSWGALFCDLILLNGFEHAVLLAASKDCEIPLVSAGSNQEEPVQALADFFTMGERWETLQNLRVAYVGPPTARLYSLLQIGARLGAQIWIGCPEKQQPRSDALLTARLDARQSKGRIEIVNDAERAIRGSDVIYLPQWKQELAGKDLKILGDFSLTPELVKLGKPGSVVMHSGGGMHGAEMSDGVLGMPNCIVRQQAENIIPVVQSIMCNLFEVANITAFERPVQQMAPSENVEDISRSVLRPK